MDGWNIFECHYIAENDYNKMEITDWIWTGAKDISIDDVGHFWKCHGYTISNQSYHLVDKQPQENAIIKHLEK